LEWTNKVIYDRAASIFQTVKTDAQKQGAVWFEEYRRIRKARNLCIEILRKLNKAWTVPNSSKIKIWNKCSNLFEKIDEDIKGQHKWEGTLIEVTDLMKSICKEVMKKLKREARKSKREDISRKVEKLIEMYEKKPGIFFKKLKNTGKHQTEIRSLHDTKSGETLSAPEDKLRILKDFWSQLYTKNKEKPMTHPPWLSKPIKEGKNANKHIKPITLEEVKNIINQMKQNKAPGNDLLPVEIIKALGDKYLK
jgi:hypothetical protein